MEKELVELEAKNIIRYVVVEEKEVMDFFISCLENPPHVWDYFHDADCKKIIVQSASEETQDLMYTTFKEKTVINLFVDNWSIPGYKISDWDYICDINKCVYVFTLHLKKEGSNHD